MKKSLVKTAVTLGIGMMIGSATLAAAAPSTIKAIISDFSVILNNENIELDFTPVVVNGMMYLPVRQLAELLDTDVKYDAKNKQIELNSNGIVPTKLPNWTIEQDALTKYDISVNFYSDITTVSLGDNQIIFHFSIDHKKNGYGMFQNDSKTATIKVEYNEIYLGKDTLKLLGIQ